MSTGLTVEGTTMRTAPSTFDGWDEALTFGRELAGMIDLPVVDRRSDEPARDD